MRILNDIACKFNSIQQFFKESIKLNSNSRKMGFKYGGEIELKKNGVEKRNLRTKFGKDTIPCFFT
jgi:hypothetical protein